MQDQKSGDENPQQISIQSLCELPETAQKGLQSLLREILSLPISLRLNSLAGIWIVPSSEIPKYINEITQRFEKTPRTYEAGPHYPEGVAVPLQLDEVGISIIFFDESLILKLTEDSFRDPETISTILEELLHVHVYTIRYATQGYIRPVKPDFSCDFDFIEIATGLHDEYGVSFLKQIIAGRFPIFEYENQLTTLQFKYGLVVKDMLDMAEQELFEVLQLVSSKRISIENAWSQVLQITYRKIFEPLVRSAGFHDPTMIEDELATLDLETSTFYKNYVQKYWEQIHKELKSSVDNNFQKMEAACLEIANLIKAFLNNLGIHISQLDNERCWVEFEKLM